MATLAGKTIGHYTLIGQIGQGGMAVVYKARDTQNDRTVAIKILTPSSAADAEVVLRFQREARLLLKLRHPHIVPVEDFQVEDGAVYLVMPYYPAGSLADRLARGPLQPAEGSRIIAQVCGALDFAHRQGVVHRDVKPSNILLDEKGNALLTDFGLAHVADASLSLTGSAVLGTPSYLSPEQVQSAKVDARSDQYSLGVVLYQMTTGRLPFEAETPMAVLVKHVSDPMPSPRSVSPSVPEIVERVILKATAKNPDDRFASIAEMNAAFQAALAHALDPKGHRPPTIHLGASSVREARPEGLGGSRRRRRVLMAAASLAVVALLAFCASPVAGPAIVDLLLGSSGPAEGSSGPGGELSDLQRTAMAQTENAFATQLVGTWSGTLLPEQILTAVAQTVAAEWGEATATPALTEETTPSVAPSQPGETSPPSRTPTPTRTPDASGRQSNTDIPTDTRTPTPTVTQTTSMIRTPTATPTVTATYPPTRTPTPSSTGTRTTTSTVPSVTPTPSPSATRTPTPSPTATRTTTSTVPSITPTIPTTVSIPIASPTSTGTDSPGAGADGPTS